MGLTMRSIESRALLTVLLLRLLVAPEPAVAADDEGVDPWHWLQSVRETLAAAPTSATFIQVFRPAGFSSGDRESGMLYLALPDCVRWDYQLPFAKSFLLCSDTVYMWNSGETTGRKHELRVSDQPGLDLMTLQVELLRDRYDAVVAASGPEQVELTLSPKAPDSELSSASVVIDPVSNRPTVIQYLDRQGNLTRFELADYSPVDRSNRFEPPSNLEWLDH